MLRVFYAADMDTYTAWEAALAPASSIARLYTPNQLAPEQADIVLYSPASPLQDLRCFAQAKAMLSLWAGVERLLANPTLPADLPIARMVEPGLVQGMVEYVVGHCLRYHLGMADQAEGQCQKQWRFRMPPLASSRSVCVFGLGQLGVAVAKALQQIGFEVSGWSRSLKTVTGMQCYAGQAQFEQALQHAQIAVVLLPLTAQTRGLFDTKVFEMMPQDSVVINAARGEIIQDIALLAALDNGQLQGATLDVFCKEPLPEAHRFWTHPNVFMTPHMASVTRPETAGAVLVKQLERIARGESPLYLVNRQHGY